MKIDEKLYKAMPVELQNLFCKCPNPGSEEVLALFPNNNAGCKPHWVEGTKEYEGWGSITKAGKMAGYDDGNNLSAARFFYCAKPSKSERDAGVYQETKSASERSGGRKEGSASLVMEDGKANPFAGTTTPSKNNHPTVKPIKLMRYLVRLVTPKNGIVLDPFMGSGTTGIAAMEEELRFIGIEQDPAYVELSRQRIQHVLDSKPATLEGIL